MARAREKSPKVNAAAPATLLAALLGANPCLAEPPFHSYGAGAFIGYGGESLIWGLETYATHTVDHQECSSDPRWGFGPLARVTMHGLSRPSFTLAAHGGRDLARPLISVSAEAGLTLAFRDGLGAEPSASPHTGVSLELSIFQTFSHQEWLLPEYTVGGGVRYFPTLGTPGVCVVGRPQRDSQGEQVATTWRHTSAPKLNAFRKAAAEEYASVPAFLQLALELRANAAPQELISRALSAARDELRHTTLCAQAISYLSGEAACLDVPEACTRNPLAGRAGLLRLAFESWVDGCLGEGLAAQIALRDEHQEPDPLLKGIHRIIAHDEQRHAELGWDILRFCVTREPDVRRLLRSRRAELALPDGCPQQPTLQQRHYQRNQRRLLALCA